ncbi:hypothetical protein [Actinomadura sp. DC4]|uniref:hypothetical protein n=1 Tax=Actinomadura sp. DC4 TaxID=3055069 RepID=UPI0025B08A31|nr:hypothetical protein [Actinomadura sp. DC4]MDN3358589.1 hypothetical protein [Actinomadura sp. DC4]
MRRTALTIAGLATAGLCTFALTGSANAADGVLTVNGTAYPHPSGCYEGGSHPLFIDNQTDQFAYVFDAPGCAGLPAGAVPPGRAEIKEGLSVLIS